MNEPPSRRRRFWLTAFLAWLIFLALDFLAHATLLRSLWARDLAALKSPQELFRLIPFGYLSFLLLTLLIGALYVRLHPGGGSLRLGLRFGMSFGLIFAASNFLAWYSAFQLPMLFLALVNLVYWVELTAAGAVFGYLMPPPSVGRRGWLLAGMAFMILVAGIIIQSLSPSAPGLTR